MRIRRYNRRDQDWGARVNHEHYLERERLAIRRAKAAYGKAYRKAMQHNPEHTPSYDTVIRRRGADGRIQITLIIEDHGTAQFCRQRGVWRCVSVDNPEFDWFTRMVHFDAVRDWLLRHGHTFYWQRDRKPSAAIGTSNDIIPGRDCGRPAEGTTALRVGASGAALERNGVITSSPLNTPA